MLTEIQRFVNWARRRNPVARTYKDYRYDLNQFADTVGHKALQDVTFQDIDWFIVKTGLVSTFYRWNCPLTT